MPHPGMDHNESAEAWQVWNACMTLLGETSTPAIERLQGLLVQLSGTWIDSLDLAQRGQLLEAAEALLQDPLPDALLMQAGRHFPELAVRMLEQGANPMAVDESRSYKPGVMQYLLDHCTGMEDAYGQADAQAWMRRAFAHAYPGPNPALMVDILVEGETNAWVMALVHDALLRGQEAAQDVLEACVRTQAPSPSMVEMALAHGADLFAQFDPEGSGEPCRVIDHAQRHPFPWAVELFNRFAAEQQHKQLQRDIEAPGTTGARPRF